MTNPTGGVRRNAFWVTAGTLTQVSCQVCTLIVLARLLTPYDFGIISIATLITQLTLIFCEYGIATSVVQRLRLEPDFLASAFWLSCGCAALMSGVMLASASALSQAFSAPELERVLQAYAAMFLLYGLTGVRDALIQRDMDYRYLAKADAFSFILGYAGIAIMCAFLGFSYWSMVIGHISQLIIRCVIIFLRPLPIAPTAPNRKQMRTMLHFGTGQTLSRLASFVAAQADGFIISSRLGVADMGYYGRANQLVTMPASQLGQIFDRLIFPYVARRQQQHREAAATYKTALMGICLLSFPASILLSMTSPNLVHILLGPQWEAVIPPMQILALAIPFRLIHKVSDPTARAMGKTYSRAWRQWLVAISVMGSTWILCNWGLAAVAAGIVASAVLDATLMVWLCCTATHLPWRVLFRALLPGIQAGGLVAILITLIAQAPLPWHDSDFYFLGLASLATATMTSLLLVRLRLKWS